MKKALLVQFDLHHRLYNNVLDGSADEETHRRLYDDENINHVKYLAPAELPVRTGDDCGTGSRDKME